VAGDAGALGYEMVEKLCVDYFGVSFGWR
jgi:hypothetical protein